jgi:alpha-2-macroglobulin
VASRIQKKLSFFRNPLLLAVIWALYYQPAYCQNLIKSRQTSYLTYIYKLTDKEAKKIYKNDLWVVDPSYFHTLVDSFPTQSIYAGTLPEGHYLKTYSEKNEQEFSITTVRHFDVFILNNNTDLCLQVYDSDGNPVTDAELSIRGKKLRFNEETQTYRDKKSNRKGLLAVSHEGFTAYYDLVRHHNNSGFRRGSRTVLYSIPVKYVWIPVRYIIFLPVDAVRSLFYRYPYGTIYRTQHFFTNSYHSIACIFDSYHCNYNNRFEQRHTGYIVFNKPKYLPGDTVKFKAFLVTKKGKPVNKPVQVVLNSNHKDVKLFDLSPYRKGGYEGEFYLHDSLEMKLDNFYYLSLKHKSWKQYISGNFRFEDYELSKNKLALRTESQEHYRNKEACLYVKGTDENDLNLQDARIEILLKPDAITEYFARQVFIPDTLLFLQKKLEPGGETRIMLPDSAFPEANFKYRILVRLLTSDNEVTEQSTWVYYYYHSEKFDMELVNDSIQFSYAKDGVPGRKKVTITANNNTGNSLLAYEGDIPGKIALNPYFSSYTVKSDSLSETIELSSFPSLLQCSTGRTIDSVFIHVDNPHGIPFSYDIYRKNAQVYAGFEDSLNLQLKTGSTQNFYLSVRYIWGGEVKNETYLVPLNDKELTISVIQPGIVYPGQKTRIDLLVTDYKGKAVEGVDLTAFSLTKKFNYTPPGLPETGKKKKEKALINNFDLNKIETRAFHSFDLDYQAWKLLAGIDSIEYYKFSYPGNSIYRFEYQPADSLTQFAPFVFSDGKMQDIHVIYVDSKPVYFSWSTNFQPYSFKIDSGYHQVKLRTTERNITIDSLYFPHGSKLIFSFNDDLVDENVRIEIAKTELSLSEQGLLYKYIMPYRNTFGERIAYTEGVNNIQLLTPGEQHFYGEILPVRYQASSLFI